MRVFFTFSLIGFLTLAGHATVFAQEQPPVIDPDTIPGTPPANDDMPAPDDRDAPLPNTPPMVVPPPDEGQGEMPDAFGGLPAPDDEAGSGYDEAPAASDSADSETREQRLQAMFEELRKEPSDAKAARIASRIQRQWSRSGSATVDLLMQRAARAMQSKDNAAALDMLDQAIVLDPDYAEAWNRRATLNFTMSRWGRSIVDIEQTLRREPHHWGALMGLAAILEQTDHKEKALETYLRVLAVYPALQSAQDAVGRLSEELTGPAI